ncbi:MAG TPA: ATP-grasp domain-containing protein [Candidatus Saccharimonadales bacterium]|nr:ATP-grasp domain-containing protein [Candidatus Saccharimonadales bacterium]
MQQGPYIADRVLPKMVQDICARRGLSYQSFSDDWVLRLQQGERVRWVVGYKFDTNNSAAGQLAQDKVATYMALHAADIPAIEHYLVRALPHDPNEWHYDIGGLDGGGPVVIKPLDGTGGRGVERYETIQEALGAIHSSGEPAWAIAPYYDVQTEYRLVMLHGRLLLSLEKTQPTFRGQLKLFNLGYGAVAVDVTDHSLLETLEAMATDVMNALSLRCAAVDIVCTEAGELRVLEVNDGIMLEHYALQSPEYKNRVETVYDAVIAAMFA